LFVQGAVVALLALSALAPRLTRDRERPSAQAAE
jgi:hypothetical protein